MFWASIKIWYVHYHIIWAFLKKNRCNLTFLWLMYTVDVVNVKWDFKSLQRVQKRSSLPPAWDAITFIIQLLMQPWQKPVCVIYEQWREACLFIINCPGWMSLFCVTEESQCIVYILCARTKSSRGRRPEDLRSFRAATLTASGLQGEKKKTNSNEHLLRRKIVTGAACRSQLRLRVT